MAHTTNRKTRLALDRAVTDYYSELSVEDAKEQARWGDFALGEFPNEAVSWRAMTHATATLRESSPRDGLLIARHRSRRASRIR